MKKSRFALVAIVALVAFSWASAQGPIRRLLQPRPAPTCTGPDWPLSAAVGPPVKLEAAPPPGVKPKIIGQALKADPPKAAAEKVGPAFGVAVRIHVRAELRKQGKSFLEAWRTSALVTDEVIAAAIPDAKAVSGQELGQFGDGTILKLILDWLDTPAGQAFFQALLDLLLRSFAGVVPGTTFGGAECPSGCPPPAATTLLS